MRGRIEWCLVVVPILSDGRRVEKILSEVQDIHSCWTKEYPIGNKLFTQRVHRVLQGPKTLETHLSIQVGTLWKFNVNPKPCLLVGGACMP